MLHFHTAKGSCFRHDRALKGPCFGGFDAVELRMSYLVDAPRAGMHASLSDAGYFG